MTIKSTKKLINHTEHGGSDALGVPRWDFSSNVNAYAIQNGVAKHILKKLKTADINHYPDPNYTKLKHKLAKWHKVKDWQIVIAGSGSEFINRISKVVAIYNNSAEVTEITKTYLPNGAYGDYEKSARGMNLQVINSNRGIEPDNELIKKYRPKLIWHCEPSSPHGLLIKSPKVDYKNAILIIDRAYAPYVLEGNLSPSPKNVWQLISPNKSLGLLGIRAAYAISPNNSQAKKWVERLNNHAPSWQIGGDGVAMLSAWANRKTQKWLAKSVVQLKIWKKAQIKICQSLGWQCIDSVTPFFLVSFKGSDDFEKRAKFVKKIRKYGIKLRDAKSLGCKGFFRISVGTPSAQKQLQKTMRRIK